MNNFLIALSQGKSLCSKAYFFLLALVFISLGFSPLAVLADEEVDSTFPVVSIGVGNGNIPENTGPTHEGVYSGNVPVYATFTDAHPSVYHFRVIADGGTDGYTCDDLFAPENQDYDKCGFLYNKSIYVTESFTNLQIATIDMARLGPNGKYWLIFGAKDEAQNRTNPYYLDDTRVSIMTSADDEEEVTPSPSPSPSPASSGGGFANGPVMGTFGVNFPGNGAIAPTQPSGSVLGAQTCSVEYISAYIKPGVKNDPEEVKKLQTFLNELFGLDIPMTGFYGPRTIAAVRKFQIMHANEVLRPWVTAGLHRDENTPTGYVYKTTKRMINIIKCPNLKTPIPQLP